MDTWNVAHLILDAAFAIAISGVVAIFLYRREKRMRALIAQYVVGAVERPEVAESPEPLAPAIVDTRPITRPTTQYRQTPNLVAQYQSQKSFVAAPTAARKATRAEKYLEAVRMYRQGSRREDIEKSLGISFMELELLGQLK